MVCTMSTIYFLKAYHIGNQYQPDKDIPALYFCVLWMLEIEYRVATPYMQL